MRVRMMVWHAAVALLGAWLLYRAAAPLRSGALFYVDGFIWAVLGGCALVLGGVGGLVERWLLRRGHAVLAAVVAVGVALAMFAVVVVFAGRLANTVRYPVTPDTYLVPLAGWLLFMGILTAVGLGGRSEPHGTTVESSGVADSGTT